MSVVTKKILVAPLNWGLGHATRCIPIIEALLKQNYEPIIASDGVALQLLQKEFPQLTFLELPAYNIEYAQNGKNFKWKMISQLPQMLRAMRAERKLVAHYVSKYQIEGIISDNRLGVFHKQIPSVFITHQLRVMSGSTSFITTWLHKQIIKKYTECWVPDVAGCPNLSGKLGHLDSEDLVPKYIGPLSRLHKKCVTKKYDLMILLSGPEPQRSLLENKLKTLLPLYDGNVILVQGLMAPLKKSNVEGNVEIHNFMMREELENTINASEMVLSRSGYTTVMDLAHLGKKAFFIPTPGQYEQEYLAIKLHKKGIVPMSFQDDFELEMLSKVNTFKGLKDVSQPLLWKELFTCFERK